MIDWRRFRGDRLGGPKLGGSGVRPELADAYARLDEWARARGIEPAG